MYNLRGLSPPAPPISPPLFIQYTCTDKQHYTTVIIVPIGHQVGHFILAYL